MTFTTRVGLASLLSLSVAAFACTSEVSGNGQGMPNMPRRCGSTTSTGGTGSMLPPDLTPEACKAAVCPAARRCGDLTGTE